MAILKNYNTPNYLTTFQASTERLDGQLRGERDPDDDDAGQPDEPTKPDVAVRQPRLRRRAPTPEWPGRLAATQEEGNS